MVKIMIDGCLYSLPMSDLYEEKFAQFINNGIIDFTFSREFDKSINMVK